MTDRTLFLTRKNFTILEPLAQHPGPSGQLQTTVPDIMMSDNWYKNTFLTKMQIMEKGPLVFTKDTLAADSDAAADTSIAK